MHIIQGIDWHKMLVPNTPVLEIVIRGSIVYLALFLLMRFVLRRQSGTLGVSDLLVVVLMADAAQNAMADDYHSIPDGIILVATLIFWNVFLDWLGHKSRWVEKLLKPAPRLLIKNGQPLRHNMDREMITKEELVGQLRLQGVEDFEEVRRAYLESDGRISVIKKNGKAEGNNKKQAGQ